MNKPKLKGKYHQKMSAAAAHTQFAQPASHIIRKANAQTDAPVTLIHRLSVYMWSDGTVDTVDHCGGKEGFQNPCQARAGSQSTKRGLTGALAQSQRPHTLPTPLRTHTANDQCNWTEQFYHR